MGMMDQSSSQHQPNLSSQRSLQSVPSLANSNSGDDDDRHNHRSVCSFTAHSAPVSSIAVANGLIFTGSANEIASCNPSLASATSAFPAGNGAVKSLAVTSNRLFSAHQDCKIRIWKIPGSGSHARVATLPTLADRAAKLLTPGSQVVFRRHVKCTWVHHVDTVSALALSPDETLLYSVSWDRSLKIWSTVDFRCLESVNAHDDAINALAVSPDGHMYTGSADKKIKVWSMRAERKSKTKTVLVATLEKHNSGVNALAVNCDGSVLYSGASDRSVVVWEKTKDCEGNFGMVVLGALRGHSEAVLCLAAVNSVVCSGSADKTIRVWRGVDRKYSCLAVLRGHGGPVKCLTAVTETSRYSDGDRDGYEDCCLVYSGGLDCEVKVWKIIVPKLF